MCLVWFFKVDKHIKDALAFEHVKEHISDYIEGVETIFHSSF